MTYRNANYTAFYVDEPYSDSNLRANATKDFCYYNMLRAWKEKDPSFPFIDAHDKTYNVMDDSDWERTLKPRLHERLGNSKNIILILSSITDSSRALREEINYGINTCGLPVIVVYPDYKTPDDIVDIHNKIKPCIKKLWDKLPVFRNSKDKVAVMHIPFDKRCIKNALKDKDFQVQTKISSGDYFFQHS